MEFYFRDPNETPLPPDQVRIKELRGVARPDGHKVRVTLQISAFQERPSGDIRILNQRGEELASLSFIEAISPHQEFTMHLHGETVNPHQILARIFYLPKDEEGNPVPEEISIQVVDEMKVDLIL
jgi:hypothetical protein